MATIPSDVILVDTTVLVDFMRGLPAAANMLDQARSHARLSCSIVTAAELMIGSRSRADQRAIEQLLNRFEIEPIVGDDSVRALNWLRRYHQSRGVGYHDCLIAASAVRLRATIVTLNEKHFAALPGVRVTRPY